MHAQSRQMREQRGQQAFALLTNVPDKARDAGRPRWRHDRLRRQRGSRVRGSWQTRVLPEPRCLITPTRRSYPRSSHSQHKPQAAQPSQHLTIRNTSQNSRQSPYFGHMQVTRKALSLVGKGPYLRKLVAGRDLNPRPLGYEPYDICLRCLGQFLAGAVTSADRTDLISVRRLCLPRLVLSRRVRFTSRFTERAIDLRFPAPSRPPLHPCHDGLAGPGSRTTPRASRSGWPGALILVRS